jgi:P-type E1-E2 ATPase
MITIDIPGNREMLVKYLVLDYNGTLAIDGKLITGLQPLLNQLSEQLEIYVLTADTFGTVEKELAEVNCQVSVIQPEEQDKQKEQFVTSLGKEYVVAIGNGLNDARMLGSAELGIVLLQAEGAAVKTLLGADVVCRHITDALELLTNPLRLKATLRN